MKKIPRLSILLLSISLLVACGGGGGGSSSSASTSSTVAAAVPTVDASDQALNVDATGTSGTLTKTINIYARDPDGLALAYSIARAPAASGSSATIDATSGLLTYNITLPTTASSDTVQVLVTAGTKRKTVTVTFQFDTTITVDPLLNSQWHLINQNTYFASDNPANNQGCDLNISPSVSRTCGSVVGVAGTSVWTEGYRGNNVNVTVVDSGLEINHEDLSGNVVTGESWNFVDNTTNPTNTSITGDHGTSVAGLIAGAANNGRGISGIAPKAKLRANNYLKSSGTVTQLSIAFGGVTGFGMTSSDIFNFSAGTESASLLSPTASNDAVYTNATTLRSSKGAIVVKSAGNGFKGMTDGSNNPIGTSTFCQASNISCQNVNNDRDNTIYSNMIVASVNADATRSSYSTTGSAIWISGFGGEYGNDIAWTTSTNGYKPALLTTDQSTCAAGYVRSSQRARNAMSDGTGGFIQNLSCNYMASFNGTSAAAPTVSGVIALILQANPNLTWRDVRHILASTARKISPSQAAITNSTYFGAGNTLTMEQGWVTNNAGFNFHNYFGFGLIDARRAVDAAKSYTLGNLGTFTSAAFTAPLAGTSITKASGLGGLTKTFSVTSGPTTIEQAEFLFFPDPGLIPYCVQIELTSPQGTKSILLNMDAAHDAVSTLASTNGTRFLSNAFYGENPRGNWILKLMNSCNTTQNVSSTQSQQLTIRGR